MSKVSREEIIRRYVAYLASSDFTPVLRRLHRTPYWRLMIAFLTFLSTAGIPIAVYQLIRFFQLRRGTWRARLIKAARRSVPIRVDVLMGNSALYRTSNAIAPALVLGTFDSETAESQQFRDDLTERIMLIGLGDAEGAGEQEVFRLMSDEAYRPDRRRIVPRDLTGGRTMILFDLQVVGEFLPTGRLEGATLPCLAEPGPSGKIQLLPWWVAEGVEAPMSN